MARPSWYRRWFGSSVKNTTAAPKSPRSADTRRRQFQPRIEALEDRCMPSVTAVSNEFRVNQTTAGSQSTSGDRTIAAAPDGRFIEVWTNTTLNNVSTIKARLYNADGTALSNEFQISTAGSANGLPSIAVDPLGTGVIVWLGVNGQAQNAIEGQLFDLNKGSLQGSNFQINQTAANGVSYPSVGLDAVGNFAVAWDRFGATVDIYARAFDSGGLPVTNEFKVNTAASSGAQLLPSVAMAADGDFLVAWESSGPNNDFKGAGGGIFAHSYANNQAVGNATQISTFAGGPQINPKTAMDAAGDYVIVWQSGSQDGSGYGVYADLVLTTGLNVTFKVNQTTAGDQINPNVAMDPAGDFVVAWDSVGQDGSSGGIYFRSFDFAGLNASNEIQANQTTTDTQDTPSVAMNGQGDFDITWQSNGQDGSLYGTYARRYLNPPQDFTYFVNSKTLTITPSGSSTFEFAQQTMLDGAGDPQLFDIFKVDQQDAYMLPDSILNSVLVGADKNGFNTATVLTGDTYQANGVTQETSEKVTIGDGGGTVARLDANGNVTKNILALGNFQTVFAVAGQADQGFIQCTPAVKNVFVGAGGYAYMNTGNNGEDFYYLKGAKYVYSYGISDTLDYCYQYDGSGASTYVVSGTAYALGLGADNGQQFFNEGVGFKFNQGVAQHPSQDIAYFYDSTGNDKYIGFSQYALMTSADGSFKEYDIAAYFTNINVFSFVGGDDVAAVYDATVNHVTGYKMV